MDRIGWQGGGARTTYLRDAELARTGNLRAAAYQTLILAW